MKYNFELEGKLNFDNIEITSPDEVISEMGKQLTEATKGFIKGVVREYDGSIESYDQLSVFASIAASLGTAVVRNDIQEKLGPINYKSSKFEFFLVAPKLDSYKYRILFFEYGIGNYPVKLVLEQGIADEIFGEDANYVIEYATKDALENLICNILKSKKVIRVMQDLINATHRIIKLDVEKKEFLEELNVDDK